MTLEILALLPLAFWLLVTLDRDRAWPRELVLPPGKRAARGPRPAVVAVVPARDEAEVRPETLPALLAQEGVELGVVLVDDGSTDATRAVARAVAGDDARLEVLAAAPAPPGWTGKIHALETGVRTVATRPGARPEWLLFTDADIRHRPGSVAALLELAQAGGPGGAAFDLVSVMARLRTDGFWERLLLPPFVFYFQLLYPFRRVPRGGTRRAAAAGGCVLLRRSALAAAGGLATIRGAVIDDVALARAVADAGGRLWLGLDPKIVSVRRYRGLAGIWGMVARTAFVQLGRRWGLLLAVLAGLVLLVVSPPFLLAIAARLAATGSADDAWRAALWAALAWGLETLALLPAVRHHRLAAGWAATLPFASILYGAMTATSAWADLRGRGARWKGRTYPAPD